MQYHRTRDFAGTSFVINREPEEDEIGSFLDSNCHPAFSNIVSNKKEALFIQHSAEDLTGITVDKHYMRSRLFKPRISIVVDLRSMITKIFSHFEGFNPEDYRTKPTYVQLRVIADGRKAYIKMLP